MADESGKRRRGRRRGRSEPQPIRPASEPDQPAQDADLEITEETETPGVTGPRFRFRRRGREGAKERRPQERAAAGGHADVSPMDFWRSGATRSHRERVVTGQGPTKLWRRLTSLYLPPWVPVVGIIGVVFAILAFLFITRSATGAPRIGKDHWHATYTYTVCGQKQPNFPTWESGVHTHGDGIIHIHPFSPSEEGSGARLSKWFEYGGGSLTGDEVRAPGSSKTYHNGDTCPDGTVGQVQVFLNGQKNDDYTHFIPHDGDRVRIVFGPTEDVIQQDDRQIIPESAVSRTLEMEVTGDTEGSAQFSPTSIAVNAGETVKIVLHNKAQISHGFRISGVDGQYGTSDDFVIKPTVPAGGAETGDLLQPSQDGSVVVRFDDPGNIEFRDETATSATGTIVVQPAASVTPAPSEAAQEPVDVTLDATAGDNFFDPKELTLPAGKKFRINLKNTGNFVHNLRIDGPDGQFGTDDDIVSKDVLKDQTADAVGQIDKAGVYKIRDDFHPTEQTGTLTVQ